MYNIFFDLKKLIKFNNHKIIRKTKNNTFNFKLFL